MRLQDLKVGESLINVKIVATDYATLEAHYNSVFLFPFEYRYDENKWYFWPNTDFNPTTFYGPDFPEEYFINLCKAKYFCLTGTKDWPTYVNIASGKELLKTAPYLG